MTHQTAIGPTRYGNGIDEDLYWCDECGAGRSWKHKPQPTARRRLVAPIAVPVGWLARAFARFHMRVIDWADRPARARYDAAWHTRNGSQDALGRSTT